jgi:hypothetical protein
MSREQLDELLNALLPFAKQQLEQHGAFYPFGARISPSGTIDHVNVHDGDEHPESQRLIDLLVDILRSSRDEYLGTGICFEARTPSPHTGETIDVIAVDLEGPEDGAVTVCLPYQRSHSGETTYGEIFAAHGTRRVFVDA